MNKIYHLSTCSTCQRILKDLGAGGVGVKAMGAGKGEAGGKAGAGGGEGKKGLVLQDIKTEKITPAQLDEMKERAGSYEALFSRRAIKYKEMGLKDQPLAEADYRRLMLEEYTFLKRPVALVGDRIFVGSEKKTVEGLGAALGK